MIWTWNIYQNVAFDPYFHNYKKSQFRQNVSYDLLAFTWRVVFVIVKNISMKQEMKNQFHAVGLVRGLFLD